MSSWVRRPLKPVPATCVRSTPSSRANLRTEGPAWAREKPGSSMGARSVRPPGMTLSVGGAEEGALEGFEEAAVGCAEALDALCAPLGVAVPAAPDVAPEAAAAPTVTPAPAVAPEAAELPTFADCAPSPPLAAAPFEAAAGAALADAALPSDPFDALAPASAPSPSTRTVATTAPAETLPPF